MDEHEFEVFWDLYPRKTAKGAARSAWEKALKKIASSEILQALSAQLRNFSEKKFTPHPATWLNQERWLDEIAPKKIAPGAAPPKHLLQQVIEDGEEFARILGDGDDEAGRQICIRLGRTLWARYLGRWRESRKYDLRQILEDAFSDIGDERLKTWLARRAQIGRPIVNTSAQEWSEP